MTLSESISRIGGIIASAPPPTSTIIRFPPNKIGSVSNMGKEIVRDRDYFTITLNELYLTKGREFWSTYDPLVFISVDFIYGTETINVPAMVGPSALKGKQELPRGFIVNDIKVAGPHPFRGGSIAIAVVLYKTKSKDYAKRVLEFGEGISKAIGVPANIELVSKVSSSLLDAFEALVSMGDCVPIAGHKIEIDGNTLQGFTSYYTALIAGDEKSRRDLSIDGSRLIDRDGSPYRANDFVVYSVSRSERRNQESTLPFYDLVSEINRAATSYGPQGWSTAKAALIALYQKMLSSPDLTSSEADLLFDKYKQQMIERRERVLKTTLMSTDKIKQTASDLNFQRLVSDLGQLDYPQ